MTEKKCITIITAMTLACALFASGAAFSADKNPDAKEIITRSENATRGDTMVSYVSITIKTKKWTRNMKMRNWDDRKRKRSFGEIVEPQKDAGNRFLLLDKTMFHYIPKLQKEVKISPSMMLQSWMGSDFTNDDIVKESSIIEDYTHSLTGKKNVNGHECYQVTLTPKPQAAVVWGKIVYYARIADCLPVRQEFYNEHGVIKKVMNCDGFAVMDGRTIPTRMKMETTGKPDRYTLMEIRKVKFNSAINPNIFTMQHLKRK